MNSFNHITAIKGTGKQPGPKQLFFQPKLTINNPNDQYEKEADAVADKVMRMEAPFIQAKPIPVLTVQRKCAHCEEEEKEQVQRKVAEYAEHSPLQSAKSNVEPVSYAPDFFLQKKCAACEAEEKNGLQRKESDGQEPQSSRSLENYVGNLGGSGQPLSTEARDFYEPRFGYDFSNVKVHTDSVAAKSAQSINALAYTSGNNIVFNSGQYSPDTDSGKRLLGHELTHVLQQNGSSAISPKLNPAKNVVQRAYWIGANPNGTPVTGTGIHNNVLNDIGSFPANSDLFTEAPIPNADLHNSGFDKVGIADFYKGSTTIGVSFPKFHIPAYMKSPQRLLKGGKRYPHIKSASPVYKPSQINLDNAPSQILIGDLKPFGAEELDPKYEEQIAHYIDGVKLAQDQINKMAVHPNQVVRNFVKNQKQWSVGVGEMSYGDLKIPDDYKIGSTNAPRVRIILKDGMNKYFLNERVYGRLYIAYRTDQKGIWNYIWAPDGSVDLSSIPQSVLDMQVNLDAITLPLQDTRLQAKRNANGNVKTPIIQRTTPGKVPEKKDNFNLDAWEGKWSKFQGQVKGVPEKDIKSAEARVKADKTQRELSNKFRGIPGPTDTPKQKKNIKTVKQLRFWSNPLSKHIGKFRKAFGTLFAKGYSAVEYIKEKVAALLSGGKTGGSGLIGAVIRLFFRIFKIAGKFLFRKTIDLILNSIVKGFAKKMETFLDDLIPDEVEAQIEKIKAIQAEYEASAVAEVSALVEKFAGPYMDVLELIKEIEAKARTFETIIDLVRWGARILACASPPAIGCLWNIAQAIIERLAAKVVESCWFTKKVGSRVAGALTAFDKIRNIPVDAAAFIIEKINGLMPKGWEKTFPIPEKSSLAALKPEYDGTCDEGGGGGATTADPFDDTRQEIFTTMEEVGEKKFNAMLDMMNAKAQGPWALLTRERLKQIKEDLKNTSAEDMQKVAKGEEPSVPLPQSLENVNKEMGKYTAEEKKTRSQYYAGQQVKADAKFQAAVEKAAKIPYPPDSELVEWMQKYKWTDLGTNREDYVVIGNQLMIFVKTKNDARIAAYANYIEHKEKNNKYIGIVSVSEFITITEVKPEDGFAVKGHNSEGQVEFYFEEFGPFAAGSKMKIGHSFIGVLLPIK